MVKQHLFNTNTFPFSVPVYTAQHIVLYFPNEVKQRPNICAIYWYRVQLNYISNIEKIFMENEKIL